MYDGKGISESKKKSGRVRIEVSFQVTYGGIKPYCLSYKWTIKG